MTPWIALTLAGTWGGYSLMRKKSPLGAVTGLTVETLLLAPVAIGFLLWQHRTGEGALGRVDLRTHVLVLSAGVITAVPLLLFAYWQIGYASPRSASCNTSRRPCS